MDDLELVPDDFEEGAHEKLDEQLRLIIPVVTPENYNLAAPLIISAIVDQSGGRLLAKYETLKEGRLLIKSPKLRDAILDGSKNGYKNLRLLKLLRQGT